MQYASRNPDTFNPVSGRNNQGIRYYLLSLPEKITVFPISRES